MMISMKKTVILLVMLVSIGSLSIPPAVSQVVEQEVELKIVAVNEFWENTNFRCKCIFDFEFEVVVTNPRSSPVTINHSDSCGFRVNITYFGAEQWNSIDTLSCFHVITPVELSPGISNHTARGAVQFPELDVGSSLPDGEYAASLVIRDGMIDNAWISQPLEFSVSTGAIAYSSNAVELSSSTISIVLGSVIVLIGRPKRKNVD